MYSECQKCALKALKVMRFLLGSVLAATQNSDILWFSFLLLKVVVIFPSDFFFCPLIT